MARKIIVLGGGAVGSVLAAALAENSAVKLVMICRGQHLEVSRRMGLTIAGDKSRSYRIDCREGIDFSLADTLVIVATKATALAETIVQILPHVERSTRLLLIQNGLDISETALTAGEQILTARQIYRGIVGFGATFFKPGTVQYWQGKLILERRMSNTPYADIFENTFLEVHWSQNIGKLIWKKAIINSIYNPLSVLLKVRNKVIAQDRLNPIKQALLQEGIAVANSQSVDPGIDLPTLNSIVSSNNVTSMLQDHLRGKPTEIEFINGAIARKGRENGIPTPVNDFLSQLILAISWVQSSNFTLPPHR